MLPLTLLATNKLLNLLTVNDALSQAINSNAAASGVSVSELNSSQIMTSYVSPDMADLNLQLIYPRVCLYTESGCKYAAGKISRLFGCRHCGRGCLVERQFGAAGEIALHFFVEGIADILQANLGDWGDGFRFSGVYSSTHAASESGRSRVCSIGASHVQSAM